jgi:hypothetical protein
MVLGLVKATRWFSGPPERTGDDMFPHSILKLIYTFIHTVKLVSMRAWIREKPAFHRKFLWSQDYSLKANVKLLLTNINCEQKGKAEIHA